MFSSRELIVAEIALDKIMPYKRDDIVVEKRWR